MPESTEQPSRSPRILLDPEWDGNACLYLTAHAARRLQQRFGLSSLRHTPFVEFTYYCEPTDIVRPVWAIPISGAHGPGYILGRWEQSIQESRYRHWFVGTTCINEQQFYGPTVADFTDEAYQRRLFVSFGGEMFVNAASIIIALAANWMVGNVKLIDGKTVVGGFTKPVSRFLQKVLTA